MSHRVHDKPSKVDGELGEVMMEGPGFVLSLTPKAARETSERLSLAADRAEAGARRRKAR